VLVEGSTGLTRMKELMDGAARSVQRTSAHLLGDDAHYDACGVALMIASWAGHPQEGSCAWEPPPNALWLPAHVVEYSPRFDVVVTRAKAGGEYKKRVFWP
jgi:hypothetical protein